MITNAQDGPGVSDKLEVVSTLTGLFRQQLAYAMNSFGTPVAKARWAELAEGFRHAARLADELAELAEERGQ